MRKTESIRPIIRWAGSKRQLIPSITSWMPKEIVNYVEPFAGSACVFFHTQPRSAVLSDINPDLMRAYRQLRRMPRELHAAVSAIPRSPEHYYKVRSWKRSELSAFQQAVRFIYLNRNCFNAVYRVNKRGEFNVPFGTKTGALPSVDEFQACARILRCATLVTGDFEAVIDTAGQGDFLYLDPPYTKSVADEPGLFGSGAFDRNDLERLVRSTKRAADRGATFLLSFEYDKILIDELTQYFVAEVTAHRHVSGFSGSRGRVPELLFTNSRGANGVG